MQGPANPFGAEEILFSRELFDEAVAALPAKLRTSAVKALIAERVLKHAPMANATGLGC